MESLHNSRNSSKNNTVWGSADTTYAPRAQHGTKLRDVLMSDKPSSYADFHHELTRNTKPDFTLPKYVGSQQSQVLERKKLKEEELVRYLSNLPSYLEKGKNEQDKALSIGVVDWRHLEKWRHSQKEMPPKHSGYSPSSSNTSLFSTDGSSTHSSKGQNFSPTRQRLRCLFPQSTMEAPPNEVHAQDGKSSSGRGHKFSTNRHIAQGCMPQSHPQRVHGGGERPPEIEVFKGNAQKFQDSTVSTGYHLSRQHKVFSGAPCERKVSDLKPVLEMGRNKYNGAATWKGKKKIQDMELTKETGRPRETKLNVIMPRDPLEHSRSVFTGVASFTVNDRLSVEPGEKYLLGRNNLEGGPPFRNGISNEQGPTVSCYQQEAGVKVSSLTSHISPQSTIKILQSPSSIKGQGDKSSIEAPHAPSFPAKRFNSPSRNRHTQEKPVDPKPEIKKETVANPSEEPSPKARNPSPIRRLSNAMGKMIKNAGSRENSPLRRSSAKDCTAKSGSESANSSLFNDNSCSDKLSANNNNNNNNNRGRSSPLRRLLDPLLKPKVSNCSEPSNKHSHNKLLDSRNGLSDVVNLRCVNATSASDALQDSKNMSSTLQGLLQVSFKNGLPLFTFAIDNESSILAATLRRSSAPGKGRNSWIYTFFAIREVKRKSGSWLNNGRKVGNHGYVPNVVAQMKVSDSCCSSSTKHENAGYFVSREFDLFAVDVGQEDEYSTDFHPTNEIAAIIVKLPRIATGNDSKDNNSGYNWLDLSLRSLEENPQMNLSTTVVLPGGLHTVPSKGEISRLAQRWRSGGLCDCGGWDLGCQLRVYANKKECGTKKECETKFDSSGYCQIKSKLQLFSQAGQDNQPVMSLAPFKERIYSVEFSSSFSLLQAFAVSVSFIDCRRPPELLEPSSVTETVTSEVGIFEAPVRSKMSNQADAPGKYVSYPPHSPVGRV